MGVLRLARMPNGVSLRPEGIDAYRAFSPRLFNMTKTSIEFSPVRRDR